METTNITELKNIISHLEELNNDKKDIQEVIKSTYNEAATKGFDKKSIRQTIRLRAINREEADKELELVPEYFKMIG
jgi:uncharacterized protein (UPF0335 family)